MSEIEEFDSELDFRLKYISGIYICTNCDNLTINPYECERCGWRADGLFKTMGKGLLYRIAEGQIQEIFNPIEKIKKERKII